MESFGKQLELPFNVTLVARFMAKVNKSDDGHWLWVGAKNKAGYGLFSIQHRCQYAHRVSYALFIGPVLAGLEVSHSSYCPYEFCVNPDCLALETKEENLRERNERIFGGDPQALYL